MTNALIVVDDYIIGQYKNIEEYLRGELSYQLKDSRIDIEIVQDNAYMFFEILEDLRNNHQKEISKGYYFKLSLEDNGYDYTILKEIKGEMKNGKNKNNKKSKSFNKIHRYIK